MSSSPLSPQARHDLSLIVLGSQSPEVARRCQAVYLLDQGHSVAHVAAVVGVGSRTTIYAWKHAYETGGLDALIHYRQRGQPSPVDATYRKQLEQLVEHAPREYGLKADGWTASLLKRTMQRLTGIKLGEDRFREVLHESGIYHQRGTTRRGDTWRKLK